MGEIDLIDKAISVVVQVPGLNGCRGLPTMLSGPPGVGKSRKIEAMLTQVKGRKPVVMTAANKDSTDFGGAPYPTYRAPRDADGVVLHEEHHDRNVVRMLPYDWAIDLAEQPGGLFIDEISQAPHSVQNAIMRVLLDRMVGDVELHPETIVLVAGNPPEYTTGTWELTAPTANRLVHLAVHAPDVTEWASGMLQGWPTVQFPILDPKEWERSYTQAMALVTTFLHKRSNYLLKLPESEAERGRAWPSPRTWDMAVRAFAGATALFPDQTDVATEVVAGCIGRGVATEFMQFVKVNDLPDPIEILRTADTFRVDRGRPDRNMAIVHSVIQTVLKPHEHQIERVKLGFTVLRRMGHEGQKDCGAIGVQPIAQFAFGHNMWKEPIVKEVVAMYSSIINEVRDK